MCSFRIVLLLLSYCVTIYNSSKCSVSWHFLTKSAFSVQPTHFSPRWFNIAFSSFTFLLLQSTTSPAFFSILMAMRCVRKKKVNMVQVCYCISTKQTKTMVIHLLDDIMNILTVFDIADIWIILREFLAHFLLKTHTRQNGVIVTQQISM